MGEGVGESEGLGLGEGEEMSDGARLEEWDGWGATSAANLFNSIRSVKEKPVPLER